ncbi:MAG: acyl--CoA ligase [Lachnospiraceae bacterium]|nr:acyl--CoA ligase [Lachnospiraceae bacterium]
MLNGSNYWDSEIAGGMETRHFRDSDFEVYKDQPPTLYCALKQTAHRYPEQIALVRPDGKAFSYSVFLEQVNRFSYYLKEQAQIKPGDHIGLLMFNSVEYAIAFLSLSQLGAVCVPLPGKFRQEEILSLIEKADLALLICHEDYSAWFQDAGFSFRVLVCRESSPETGLSDFTMCSPPLTDCFQAADAPAILMFTSGTTSKSKGAYLYNYSVMHAVCSYSRIFAIQPGERTLLAVPIYHITGLVAILGVMLYAGGTTWLHRFFHAKDAVRTMREERITFFHASPTVFSLLLQERDETPVLPDLRLLACGSSNMAREKIMALHQWMPHMEFRTVYGLTETSSPATIFPCDAAGSPYIGSSGIPIPGLCCKIVGEDGQELPPLQPGEILLRGTNLFTCYYNSTLPAYEAGWFHSGDIGYVNEAGYLFISDRKKDMINRGGEKICSFDVENVLYSLEQVEEAAVVGIPDDVYGEVAAAAIVTKAGYTLTEDGMKAALKNRLATYKIPVRLLLLEKLPETSNHKIDKKAIRQLFLKETEVSP